MNVSLSLVGSSVNHNLQLSSPTRRAKLNMYQSPSSSAVGEEASVNWLCLQGLEAAPFSGA